MYKMLFIEMYSILPALKCMKAVILRQDRGIWKKELDYPVKPDNDNYYFCRHSRGSNRESIVFKKQRNYGFPLSDLSDSPRRKGLRE
jgi:hypothetical protein